MKLYKKQLLSLICLMAISVNTVNAAFDTKKIISTNFSVTFYQSPAPLILELYSSPTLENSANNLNGTTISKTSLFAFSDIRIMLMRAYLKIQPKGIYDVTIYTNNLDKNNDGQVDTYIDFNGDGIVDVTKPAKWNSFSPNQKDAWISQYSGFYHSIMPTLMLPVKVWCPITAGHLTKKDYDNNGRTEQIAPPAKIVNDHQEPDNADPRINDYDCDSQSWAWFGNSKTTPPNDPNYFPGSYTYIPEKLAIDTNAISPVEGSYRKKIAGIIYGTDISKKTEISYGIDCKLAGDGTYKGRIYIDLRSN